MGNLSDETRAKLEELGITDVNAILSENEEAKAYAEALEEEVKKSKEELDSDPEIDEEIRIEEEDRLAKMAELNNSFVSVEQKEKPRLVKIPGNLKQNFSNVAKKLKSTDINTSVVELEDKLIKIMNSKKPKFAKVCDMNYKLFAMGEKIGVNDPENDAKIEKYREAVEIFRDFDKIKLSQVIAKTNNLENSKLKEALLTKIEEKRNALDLNVEKLNNSMISTDITDSPETYSSFRSESNTELYPTVPFSTTKLFNKVNNAMFDLEDELDKESFDVVDCRNEYNNIKFMLEKLAKRSAIRHNTGFSKSTMPNFEAKLKNLEKIIIENEKYLESKQDVPMVDIVEENTPVVEEPTIIEDQVQEIVEEPEIVEVDTIEESEQEKAINNIEDLIEKAKNNDYEQRQEMVNTFSKALNDAFDKGYISEEQRNQYKADFLQSIVKLSQPERVNIFKNTLSRAISNLKEEPTVENKQQLETFFNSVCDKALTGGFITEEECADYKNQFDSVELLAPVIEQPVEETVEPTIEETNITNLGSEMNFAYNELSKKCDKLTKNYYRLINSPQSVNLLREDLQSFEDVNFQKLYDQLSSEEKNDINNKIAQIKQGLDYKERIVFSKNGFEEAMMAINSLSNEAEILDQENEIDKIAKKEAQLQKMAKMYVKDKDKYSNQQKNAMLAAISKVEKELKTMKATIHLDEGITQGLYNEFELIQRNIMNCEKLRYIEPQYEQLKINLEKFDKEVSSADKFKFVQLKASIESKIQILKTREMNAKEIYKNDLEQIRVLDTKINQVSSTQEYNECVKLLNDKIAITNGANLNVLAEEDHVRLNNILNSLKMNLDSKAYAYAERTVEPVVSNVEKYKFLLTTLYNTCNEMDNAIDKSNYASNISELEQMMIESKGSFTKEQQMELDDMLGRAQSMLASNEMSAGKAR